ncbi:PulJ/GspJ family protein [Neptuniibacter caesariensis]|uniref:Putative MSHA biogenesis protein MshO n=1 Tax=Neptuniibacter caesariensis TaxID=207954 RepID=A0A7U8C7B1_NEPCE|nr:prepilin-type N-terminal cleavage/methylation domain-containing protein [Neptuniibacter caesariensis]EAR61206.1 putative MSHA biogenesis protein MshO [Oceanospirillum sp. MED92] [Neptuniibacter caesariensis]
MRQRGFTLIELIIVITMMGIISLVTVGFITSSMQGYADLTRRDQLSSAVRVAVERMAREVRNALPNSIRVNADGSCMEFIPALAASRYVAVPLAVASGGFSSVPFAVEPPQGRIAVYPIDTNRIDETASGADDSSRTSTQNPIYDLDSWSIISPLITSGALESGSGTVTVDFNGASTHRFPADSPAQRYFIVDEPVSFCLVGSDLYRFQGENGSAYSFAQNQSDGAALFANLSEPQEALLASDVVSPVGSQPFRYEDATLQRNGIVLFDLFIQDQDLSVADTTQEGIRVQFEVQVKNVP